MYQQTPTASNIMNLRKRLGFTQEQVAAYLGMPNHTMISYYETGKRSDIPLDVLERLADLYRVELYDLMEEDLSLQAVNMAFAFRADEFEVQDIAAISQFNKVVKNYLKMKRLAENVAK
jgi:transcriptional regulator with XRE-family HTH domain